MQQQNNLYMYNIYFGNISLRNSGYYHRDVSGLTKMLIYFFIRVQNREHQYCVNRVFRNFLAGNIVNSVHISHTRILAKSWSSRFSLKSWLINDVGRQVVLATIYALLTVHQGRNVLISSRFPIIFLFFREKGLGVISSFCYLLQPSLATATLPPLVEARQLT